MSSRPDPDPRYIDAVNGAVSFLRASLRELTTHQIIVLIAAPVADGEKGDYQYIMNAHPMSKLPVYLSLREVTTELGSELNKEIDETLEEVAKQIISSLIQKREAENN
jgi:hypothetical protein